MSCSLNMDEKLHYYKILVWQEGGGNATIWMGWCDIRAIIYKVANGINPIMVVNQPRYTDNVTLNQLSIYVSNKYMYNQDIAIPFIQYILGITFYPSNHVGQ